MPSWIDHAVFYHIYPLGFCDALFPNDLSGPPVDRLSKIATWLDHIQSLGANALYLGPLFESSYHGYDTADYYHVDRRLGCDDSLAALSADLHRRGLRLVLDGVFNHVGRQFWGFRDLQAGLQGSRCRDWFANLSFDRRSPYNDPFAYEGWNGHYELVKLNLSHPPVREHLFQAIESWIRDFQIDGLRLDAADCLDFDFLRELAAFCRKLKPDFWLMGEIIHGDYRRWANPDLLDSVTNYEVYKSLYSSLKDRNYFELGYALNRQFGPGGIYRDRLLYNFADNHDVDRVASLLDNPAHFYPLYIALFTIPGVPSIYYGSEWGIQAKKSRGDDRPLRPALDLAQCQRGAPQPNLTPLITLLASIRKNSPALRNGAYHQLYVSHEQLVFLRESNSQSIAVALNAASQPARVTFQLPGCPTGQLVDLLNPSESFPIQSGTMTLDLHPSWGRILKWVG